jgi:pimeloyl-ACP methyl ester carboxylesterase
MGYHREALDRRLGGIPRWPALALCALAFVGLILLDWGHDSGRLATWPLVKGLAGQAYGQVFNKPSVAWGRVVAFAIVAGFLFLLVTQFWRPVRWLTGWLLLPLGQASLLAYGLHLIVIVVVYNLDRWDLYDRSLLVNTLLQALAVGIVWGLVKSWHSLGALPHRLLEAPLPIPARLRPVVVASSVLLLIVSVSTAVMVGPVSASRSANMAEAPNEAGTLVYVPESAPQTEPVRVLLVLPDHRTTGPTTALPLVDAASQAGWAVVAPTLDYGDWRTENDVRAASANLLPSIKSMLEQMNVRIDRPTRPRAFIFGRGRGGQMAQIFTLFYPELVRGVATVDAIPCTLPRVSVASGSGQRPLIFPQGVGDLADYRGQPEDFNALSKVSYWLMPSSGNPDLLRSCEWLDPSLDPNRQVNSFAQTLAGIGADVRVVRSEPGVPVWRQGYDFLAGLQPN